MMADTLTISTLRELITYIVVIAGIDEGGIWVLPRLEDDP